MHTEEPSLLDHFHEIRKGLNNSEGNGVSTIIFAGRIRSEGDIQDVLYVHRKIVEDTVNREQCNVTGLLMGQGNSVLHLLEGPCYSILQILDQLAEHPHFSDEGIQLGRIIYCVEDRPARLYPEWYSCTIQERKSAVEDLSSGNIVDIVHDLAHGLSVVGKGLQSEVQQEVELNRFAEHLPGKNLILSLAACGDFFTIEDFVETYSGAYHLDLDGELTWPIDAIVKY